MARLAETRRALDEMATEFFWVPIDAQRTLDATVLRNEKPGDRAYRYRRPLVGNRGNDLVVSRRLKKGGLLACPVLGLGVFCPHS